MTPQKELKLAYSLAIILLVVGVISYAAFPAKMPEQPIRIMYKSVAGKVLFDHKTHATDKGYALYCQDCHHHPEEDEELALESCRYCHQTTMEDDRLPVTCNDCHDPDMIEGTEVPKSADAFHSQCESCHQEAEVGPQENRCNWCHVS